MSDNKPPSFSGVFRQEESILYDRYCFDDLLSLDFSIYTPTVSFSIDGSYTLPKSLYSGCSIDLDFNNFSSSVFFSTKKSPNLYVGLPSYRTNLFNSTFKSSLSLLVALKNSQIDPNFTATGLWTSESFKGKVKLNKSKIVGSFTAGSKEIGAGLRANFSIKELGWTGYSVVGWYCDKILKLKGRFENRLKDKKKLNIWMFYPIFENADFVAKLETSLGQEHHIMAGLDGKVWEKGGWKVKGDNKGKIALALYNKILPRTKAHVSAEVDLINLGGLAKFGVYFRFREKREDSS